MVLYAVLNSAVLAERCCSGTEAETLNDPSKAPSQSLQTGHFAREILEQIRLPPEVNRILYIRNLPYKITAEEMYDIFGKYGPIRQIRVGNTPETRGTAYVVYEDIFDAKNACDHLSGFNVCNRYLVVLYYNANRAFQKMDTKKKEEQLKLLKEKYGINTDPPK
nr:splicing factor 3B subunit 6 [Pelodiscus sinensis]|eukprot:XP_006118599.2 splicing factor 3B subunit 6 [Pelodiscus sinensis]